MPNVSNPPGLTESGDVDHDETQGGTEGNPHSESADTNHGNENHSSTFAVDGDTQPPESHGNGAHTSTFAVDGAAQPPENHGNESHSSQFSTIPGGVVVEQQGPLGRKGQATKVDFMRGEREKHRGVEANGLIYAIGGEDRDGNNLRSVEEYDPDTDTWTSVASMSVTRRLFGAAEAGGKLYAIGGLTGGSRDSAEEYDPDTNSWTNIAPPGKEPYDLAAAGVGGEVYSIGGDGVDAAGVDKYDPATDSWSAVASLNQPREAHGAAELDGLLYAIAGVDPETFNTLASVEEYDPNTDTWTFVDSLGTIRARSPATATAGGKLYVLGGVDDSSTTDKVEEYDPSTGTWSEATSLIDKRQRTAGGGTDGAVYVFGGTVSTDTLQDTEKLQFTQFDDVYSSAGDVLIGSEDPNVRLLNRSTGREANPNVARDGETVAAITQTDARFYRTEER